MVSNAEYSWKYSEIVDLLGFFSAFSPSVPDAGSEARALRARRKSDSGQKNRRVEAAGSIQGGGKNWGVHDSQKAIPGPLKNPSSPQPPCVRGDPLTVALPDRSAPALR